MDSKKKELFRDLYNTWERFEHTRTTKQWAELATEIDKGLNKANANGLGEVYKNMAFAMCDQIERENKNVQ